MDLATLEIFQVVVAEMSVTKAAARLGRVQSNVSTRIQQLEEELGTALFVREGKRLRLTERGAVFLDYAKRLLALADEARQAMHPTQPGGTLRIGAMESTAATRLPAVVSAFHQQWPAVDLKVSTGHSQGLMAALNDDMLDCALLALPPHEPGSAEALLASQNLVGRAVFHEQIMLLVAASHPFALAPDDSSLRLAAFKSGCSYRALGQRWLAEHWPKTANSMEIQDIASYDEMIARVAAGQCASFVPRSVLERNAPLPGIRVTHALDADTWLVTRVGFKTAAFERFSALTGQSADQGAMS
ncbi:DNA-binding transcriptional LysR family regulator [Pseudomonas sp. JUb42]|jgi:DNA-binding transcriptional LysR family regulator|uniref:LysR family transcriptional regulator n=1 Tax=Pseudomonas sp. JUb42 TaxID=2940611 RepID=UPI00216A674A|nr:LysR substrate-binding domain-containing protein [Pseudomonas sp. JUb42]MCS3468763.1 DNA-binding transcriptional LysR family regulator [Pseudomonas sp. JUb42]